MAGLYVLYWMDRIVWIVLVLVLGLLGETRNWISNFWMRRMERMGRGWDKDGMKVPMLAGGAGTGAPPLDLEGRQAAGSDGCHQLRR